mmetsp:Transcript_12312/g.18056  ORF Transcript_12312/g.18056 Transcript_12312/m.18056 type:complete len:226 (+) Transcript_12312:101-778(+)
MTKRSLVIVENKSSSRSRRCETEDVVPSSSSSTSNIENLMELALKLVIFEGHLYRSEASIIAACSKNWEKLWKHYRNYFPLYCIIQVRPIFIRTGPPSQLPSWVKEPKLLQSHEFIKVVFNKINALRVAGKRTKKLRAEAAANLPAFEDFQYAEISVWENNVRRNANSSSNTRHCGFTLEMGKCRRHVKDRQLGVSSWYCRLNPDYTIMTGISSSKVYDKSPLWP